MPSQDPPPTPEPQPAGRRWGRWLLGCVVAAGLLCCGGPICGLGGLSWYGERQLERDQREFAGGDFEAAFVNADPRLRQAHPRDEFLRLLKLRPGRDAPPLAIKTLLAVPAKGFLH